MCYVIAKDFYGCHRFSQINRGLDILDLADPARALLPSRWDIEDKPPGQKGTERYAKSKTAAPAYPDSFDLTTIKK